MFLLLTHPGNCGRAKAAFPRGRRREGKAGSPGSWEPAKLLTWARKEEWEVVGGGTLYAGNKLLQREGDATCPALGVL